MELTKPRWTVIFLGALSGTVRGALVMAALMTVVTMMGTAMVQEAMNTPMYARGGGNLLIGFAFMWAICVVPLFLYLVTFGAGAIWLAYAKRHVSYKILLTAFVGVPFLLFGLIPTLQLLMLEEQKGLLQMLISAQTVMQLVFGVIAALGNGIGFSNLWDTTYPETVAIK